MMPPPFKFASIMVVWAAVTAMITAMQPGSPDFNWIFGVVMIGCATAVTINVLESNKNASRPPMEGFTPDMAAKIKAKRGETGLSDMLALLDDDDLHEVRQRLKQRLLDQIDSGALDEAESFEQLLGQAAREKRR